MVSIYKICIVNEFLTDFFYESIGDSSRKCLTLRKWYYDIWAALYFKLRLRLRHSLSLIRTTSTNNYVLLIEISIKNFNMTCA